MNWPLEPQPTAVLASLLLATLYVASIYVAAALFRAPGVALHDRDHPHAIRQRMYGVSLATVAALLVSAGLLVYWKSSAQAAEIAGRLGLSVRAAGPSLVVSLVLVSVLFLGPLVADHLDGHFSWSALRRVPSNLSCQPELLRNYVVGPITEELLFRASVIPLWLEAGLSSTVTVFVSPTIFAVAHIHHAWARYFVHDERLVAVLLSLLLQLAYTTLFGWIAAALFVRSKSVVGPIAAHVFCNVQGLPDVYRALNHAKYKYLICVAYVAGLVGFIVLFEPMTRPGVLIE